MQTRQEFIPGFVFEKTPDNAQVIYLANNYDVTSSGLKGADKAPAAIRECLEQQIETRDRYTGTDLTQRAVFHWADLGDLNSLSPAQMVSRVEQEYLRLLNGDSTKRKFIVSIGGDHSTPIGIWKALSQKWRPEDITLLHIDAHFDLRDTDEFHITPYGKYAHCSVMRRAVEHGFHIVSVGIRDYSQEELDFALAHNDTITFFEMANKSSWSVADIARSIKTKLVYITIDVDGFDPSVFPITGTPVPGGLSWNMGIELLQTVAAKCEIIGADINEVAMSESEPFATYRTIFSAAKLAYLIPCLALEEKFKKN